MKNDPSQTAAEPAPPEKTQSDQQTPPVAPTSLHTTDRINLCNRTVVYKRRRKGRHLGDGLIEVVVSPEAKISKHEKLILTLLRKGRTGQPQHWYRERVDGERMRTSKARGSILAIWRMTGEAPPDIMVRLGLTAEEIGRIHPFTSKVEWS